MTERRQIIFDSVVKLRQERDAAIERAEKAEAELAHLRVDICNLSVARGDEARRAEKAEARAQAEEKQGLIWCERAIAAEGRAEKAESALAEQKERARVGRLHAMETKRRLREVIGRVEWRASGAHFQCLWCGGLRDYKGHTPDCARQAALKSTTQESSEEKEIENALP